MTQNQLAYQSNLIQQTHNAAQDEAKRKEAEAKLRESYASENKARTDFLRYVMESQYKSADVIHQGMSAAGQLLRGIGSFASLIS